LARLKDEHGDEEQEEGKDALEPAWSVAIPDPVDKGAVTFETTQEHQAG
jgi:hypothetical protein